MFKFINCADTSVFDNNTDSPHVAETPVFAYIPPRAYLGLKYFTDELHKNCSDFRHQQNHCHYIITISVINNINIIT